jgi:Protein of unknown function (DUF2971)
MGTADYLKVLDKTPSPLASSQPDDVLYHYTSQRGLAGIVEKRKLWATHIRYLNDSKELDYASELARDHLCRERESGDKHRRQFAMKALSDLDSLVGIETPLTVYVTSFSRHGNQLSQWRGYCPPGNGFSLGFRVNDLRKLAEKRSYEFDIAFIPCLYDVGEQNALMSELISTARTTPTDVSPEFLFILLILKWGPAIKHRGFEEEAEWRLVVRGMRNDSLLREGGSFLIPYVEVDLADTGQKGIDCIASVTVGPTPHPELSEQSVRDLLERHNVRNCITSRSEIPFRNW